MGREFAMQFTVRYDECDAGRQLRPSVYLCYTQEAATSDARDIGWAGNPWVIRRTQLTIHQAAKYTDKITLTTWAMGFTRSLAQRAYQFRNAEGTLMAEAQSLWVSLDAATLRPLRIGPEIYRAWFSEGEPPPAPGLPNWPELPTETSYQSSIKVGYTLLDGMQHVNNARYLDVLDDAGWLAWTQQNSEAQIEARPGLRFYDIEYYQPAKFAEELSIDTWLAQGEGELIRTQKMSRNGQLITRSQAHFSL